MSPHDDDRDDLAETPPQSISDHNEEPAEPAERAQAAAFAQLIDTVIAGADLPALMAVEQRELVETAAILRANLRVDGSVGSGVGGVVDRVMGQVTGQDADARSTRTEADARPPASEHSDVIDLVARRRRRVRWLSVGSAVVAAAVVLIFALRTHPPEPRDARVAPELSMIHHSRPADPLIGEIPRTQADRASDRLDTIYADRMAGYRDLRFRGGVR